MKVAVIGTGHVGLVTAATSESALGVPVIVSDACGVVEVLDRAAHRWCRSAGSDSSAPRSPSSWVRPVRLRANACGERASFNPRLVAMAEQQLAPYRGVTGR